MSIQFQRAERQQNTLQCTEHQNETITNYCSAIDCLKQLCPECMFTHNLMHKQKHTYPEIESLRGVIQNSQKRLKDAGIAFQKEVINIENQIHEPQIYHQESLTQLQKMKKQILNLVELHFQELEHKLVQSTQDINKKFMVYIIKLNVLQHVAPQIEKLKQFQKEIELMNKQLDPHDSQLFSTLQRVALLDIDQFLDKFKNELAKNIASLNFEQLILRQDDASPRIGQLKQEIEKCVPLISYRHHPNSSHSVVKSGNFNYVDSYGQGTAVNQTQIQYSRISDDGMFTQVHHEQSSPSVHDSFQVSETKQTIRKKENILRPNSITNNYDIDDTKQVMHINQPDYFLKSCGRKFLHFFQNDSTNLFFFDLSQMGSGRQVVDFQLIELCNNFTVPSFHRSIATPNGILYLVGGTLGDGQKSGITYQFDFATSSLQAVSMMMYPRSSHGIVYLNGYIYAIGGYEQKHIMTSKCERMSLKGKWESIASLNQVCTSMSVCAFGKDHIYKFGGITANFNGQYISNNIERFDATQNTWKLIEAHVPHPIQHLSTAACVQINQTDIMIFGGYNEDNIGSNQSYVLTQQDDRSHVVHSINSKPLPFSEAFWNSQTIIHDGVLYVLQNVSGESDDSCLEDERLVLSFNGRDWKLIE